MAYITLLTAYGQDAQSNREAWRTLRNETAMYLQPLYASVNLAVSLDGTLKTKIESYDIKTLVSNPGFKAMINSLKGTKANEHEMCFRQMKLADSIQSYLSV